MQVCLITFRSVTPAQRGEKLLTEQGIRCVLGRTPRRMQEQGCGYSLQIPCADVPAALRWMRSQNIAYRKLYRRQENGTWEEMEQ